MNWKAQKLENDRRWIVSAAGGEAIALCNVREDAEAIATALNAQRIPSVITTRAKEGFSVLRALKNAREVVDAASFTDPLMQDHQRVAYDDLEEMICAVR